MRKILRTILGFLLITIGLFLALPGVPGPGLAVAFLGLVLLADHFAWARRLRDWARAKSAGLRRRAGWK